MRFYEVLFCGFCKVRFLKARFCKNRFHSMRSFWVFLSLFLPLGATQINDFAKDFEQSSNAMASASTNGFANDFEALFEPKLQREYRILGVFGEQELELHIQAILNSKVLIHDKWYKIGDKIGAYHIYSITQNSITLIDKKSNQKILRLKTKDNQQPSQNLAQSSSQAFPQNKENLLKSNPISSTTKGTQ